MEVRLKKYPEGITLSPFSEQVFLVLSRYTVFPWPILKTQSERLSICPEKLSPHDLPALLQPLVKSITTFASPQKGDACLQDLEKLLENR